MRGIHKTDMLSSSLLRQRSLKNASA